MNWKVRIFLQIWELNYTFYAGDYSEVQFYLIYLRIWTTEKVMVGKMHFRIIAAKMQRNSSGSEILNLFRHSSPKSIEWFIEDQAFSSSYDLAPPRPLQSVCSAGDTQEDWEIETTCPYGRGGRGGGGSKSHLREGKPGPLYIIQYSFLFTTSRAFSPPPPAAVRGRSKCTHKGYNVCG
jgi:hypothetical protein